LTNNGDKESFAPDLYASHAYTLITSLIAAYKPTHILIERQRFRSGGGSAVQEWTIRVGVFEGMLYAVLQTLIREANRQAVDIVVQGVEPQRVAKYWIEKDRPASARQPETEKKNNKKISSKEGKKAKIDVVGRWLTTWTNFHCSTQATQEGPPQIQLSSDSQVKIVAEAYLRKWSGKSRTRSGGSSLGDDLTMAELSEQNPERTAPKTKTRKRAMQAPSSTRETKLAEEPNWNCPETPPCPSQAAIDIGKLDDLADCLLQGIAWLEWQNMRAKIAREGLAAVPFEGGDGSGPHRKY
jgi:cruciform cutting endonuclease 1